MKNKRLLSKREIQKEELGILVDFFNYARSNDLRFFLFAGTALGAIRHNGFIPWDDDIDICMPRPDYDKFISLINNEECPLGKKYSVEAPGISRNPKYLFAKIFNKEIKLDAENGIDSNYLWIDIFPLDGVPNRHTKNFILRLKRKRLAFIRKRYVHYHPKDMIADNKNIIHRLLAKCIRAPYKIRRYDRVVNSAIKLCKKNSFDSSENICPNVWVLNEKDIMPKEWIGNKVRTAQFEGYEFPVYEKCELYLAKRYGKDYMKLPPEEERETHSFNAWRVYEG